MCPHTTQVLTMESLDQCYQDNTEVICSTNLTNNPANVCQLGFPSNIDSKLTFPQNHLQANDCTNIDITIALWNLCCSSTCRVPVSLQ